MIEDIIEEWKMKIKIDERKIMRERMGGERMEKRGEMEKICIYKRGKERIEIDDVSEEVGDVEGI